MGIDLHNLNFLAHGEDLGVSYARTLAMGRQALFVDPPELERHRRRRGLPPLPAPAPGAPFYFEPLMRLWFGAQVADSVDASPYEQATQVHDMNLPWPADSPLRGHYDAVLDFGCLEHVFDFPTAWRNCVDLCRVGGHVLHALPANNLSGHGFYQFSPELFCSLYQPARGFELRGLFMAMKAEPRCWWRVASPLDVRRRVNLCNGHEVYLMVLARKLAEPGALPPPQQSDYALDAWQRPGGAAPVPVPVPVPTPRLPAWLDTLGLRAPLRRWRHRWAGLRRARLDLPAPDHQRVDVDALVRARHGRPAA